MQSNSTFVKLVKKPKENVKMKREKHEWQRPAKDKRDFNKGE